MADQFAELADDCSFFLFKRIGPVSIDIQDAIDGSLVNNGNRGRRTDSVRVNL